MGSRRVRHDWAHTYTHTHARTRWWCWPLWPLVDNECEQKWQWHMPWFSQPILSVRRDPQSFPSFWHDYLQCFWSQVLRPGGRVVWRAQFRAKNRALIRNWELEISASCLRRWVWGLSVQQNQPILTYMQNLSNLLQWALLLHLLLWSGPNSLTYFLWPPNSFWTLLLPYHLNLTAFK